MPDAACTTDLARISMQIRPLRGQLAILDADLAAQLGVSLERFRELIRESKFRLSAEFVFALEPGEWADTVSGNALAEWPGSEGPRLAFTEHGVIVAASAVGSVHAIETAIQIVRAFVKCREVLPVLDRRPGGALH